MKRREGFWPVFLVIAFLCIVILFLSLSGKLKFLSSFLEKGTSAVQSVTFGVFQKLPFVAEDEKIKKLEDERLELLSRVSELERLKKENAALSDQFQTVYPQSVQLLEAHIIGAPSFVPGVSVPNSFIINKGSRDDLRVGQAVVVKDNLIGIVSKTSENLSQINLISNPSVSFTGKTQTGAAGIVKGGTELTLDNILLSENIKKDELVLTKGDVNSEGIGVPPDLVVGKVTSVEKNPSDLFQKARVESFVNLGNLFSVFIFMQIK